MAWIKEHEAQKELFSVSELIKPAEKTLFDGGDDD
jgi:hypothetical protein